MSIQYLRQKPIPEWKKKQVKLLKDLVKKYPTIAIADITFVTAPVLHEIRAKLRERGDILRVVKNRLAQRALKESGLPNIEKLSKYLTGSNAMIFTTLNPFQLKLFFDKNKIAREAKAGDIAQSDIILSAGNTNLPPGPILSIFSKLRVPTRIQEGSIWVEKDTLIAKKGEVITAELAELLKKLDIKPIEVGLRVKAAYTDKVVISEEELSLNLDEYKETVSKAATESLNLAINAVYPLKETIPYILAKAQNESLSLALNAALPIKEGLQLSLAKAVATATQIYNLIKDRLG
ncbi:MAG: 50S ribosomal protein L10 [Thermoprotei archaeon]|nr:MAG: 50S ribosomal protein L10 [Thermoprotei archaeon]